eukprot:SAG31_NODE_3403_length_4306_cov_3.734156_1_plen_55_part_10
MEDVALLREVLGQGRSLDGQIRGIVDGGRLVAALGAVSLRAGPRWDRGLKDRRGS